MQNKLTLATITTLGVLIAGTAQAAVLVPNSELQLTGTLIGPNTDPNDIRVLLFSPDEDSLSNPTPPAPIGQYATVNIGASSNSGSFVAFNAPNVGPPVTRPYLGSVLSVDFGQDVTGAGIVNLAAPILNFVKIPGVTDLTGTIADTFISLTSVRIDNLGITNGFQRFAFTGFGFADNEGDISPVQYDFTAQGAVDPVTGGATVNTLYSYSGTVKVNAPRFYGNYPVQQCRSIVTGKQIGRASCRERV